MNDAAAYARELGLRGDFVLSVGATPTAHAASSSLTSDGRALEGKLELHAGCYTLNDLQQAATGLVTSPRSTALSVLTTVVSTYAHRGEAVCDAGALAVSKDTGSEPGYGRVTSHNGWALGRVSQEHGVLVHAASLRGTTGGEAGTGNGDGDGEDGAVADLKIGDRVRFTPQHACLVCACFPWIYVVDGGDTVVDVWVPWKGW